MERIFCLQSTLKAKNTFLIPISFVQGMPLAVMREGQAMQLRLGYCYVILADFHLTSGIDCLLVAHHFRI
jgi:hypothetical protein